MRVNKRTRRLQKEKPFPKGGIRSAYVRALEKDHEQLEMQHQSLLQAQLELETSRDHYVELFDSAPVCFLTLTQRGLIREINAPGMRLLTLRRGHFKGWPFINFVAPKDRKNFMGHLSRCRNNADPTHPMSVELELLRKPDEKSVFIELVGMPSIEGSDIKSVFRDVTHFKEMREVHRWLAAIVESSGDAIIGNDIEGTIISCNRGAERLFGYSSEKLIGRPMNVLIPQERQSEETRILHRLQRGDKIECYETVRRCKDGSLLPVSLTLSSIRDAHGKIIGFSNIAHDISQSKEGERKLQESLAREKAANQAKDNFLAALSHELRTPLNPALLLASDGADNPDHSAQVRGDFDTIRKNIELEARLIDDLLDLTRIIRGKLIVEKKPLNIHTALQDAAEMVRSDVVQKKIEFVLRLNAKSPVVLGDAVRLRQIFWNVLKNAVKFTPHHGKISIETRSAGGTISISITDTGIGIDPGEIDHIFGAFSQGPHQFGGLGLGLAISRAVTEMHDGSIRAESPGKGKGATFIVELPLAQEVKKQEKTAPSENLSAKIVSGKGIRILLVEDHEPTRTSLMSLLVRRKYRVVPAGSMSEARHLLKKEKFNLLISDIGLPDGNGCELMEESQKQSHLKGIALTGYGMEQDIARTRVAGFIAHLTKPVHVDSLDNALTLAMKKLR
ncbi:MAG TPA: PAS domain S-box protein [Verrucomicrobiae bacterium]|jgi:PAS domain S-box-containing protein